jgi:hypothetical protein
MLCDAKNSVPFQFLSVSSMDFKNISIRKWLNIVAKNKKPRISGEIRGRYFMLKGQSIASDTPFLMVGTSISPP